MMCECEFCIPQQNGVFFCSKFKLYGSSKLNICTYTLMQEAWDERISQIPPQVIEKVRDYLDFHF